MDWHRWQRKRGRCNSGTTRVGLWALVVLLVAWPPGFPGCGVRGNPARLEAGRARDVQGLAAMAAGAQRNP
ncbi:hypothetical protein VSS37_18765 [Candidatus Thiothrix sp. Deng01]|uniref:Uncharacterized protein n=1 Tax=Candidatus Thiothrix phosphatis TaxID=3112415 RepID=A0ABU6D3Y1_9GAMM|nr:hypothetical protein [Candidatus Thiothrix sp. Deng01]MEB4593029.1 hypothetical protein [Candidatus Thiothrix sp. Deng01]